MHVIDAIAPDPAGAPEAARRLQDEGPGAARSRSTSPAPQIDDVAPRLLHAAPEHADRPEHHLAALPRPGSRGIGFEIFHPGVVLPGALGAVALVTALFGLSVLPISVGRARADPARRGLLVVDAHVSSHGALTVAGLIAHRRSGCCCSSTTRRRPTTRRVPLVIRSPPSLGGFWALALTKAVQVRRTPVAVGPQEIVGEHGVVRGDGLVFVHGELWQARAERRRAARARRARRGRRRRGDAGARRPGARGPAVSASRPATRCHGRIDAWTAA